MEGALAIRALQLQAYAAAIDALRAAGNNNNQNTHALLQNLQTVFKISDVSFLSLLSITMFWNILFSQNPRDVSFCFLHITT